MMFTLKRFAESIMRNITFILLGVVITTLFQSTTVPVAVARDARDDGRSVTIASQAPAASTWISCTPVQVVAYASRVHVKCSAAVSGVIYFAVSTADPANAARILSVLSTARVAGRPLDILYDPADTSGTAIGCAASDCRLLQAAGF